MHAAGTMQPARQPRRSGYGGRLGSNSWGELRPRAVKRQTHLNIRIFVPLVAARTLLPRTTCVRDAPVCEYARGRLVYGMLWQPLCIYKHDHVMRV